jgi:hypothetical protein
LAVDHKRVWATPQLENLGPGREGGEPLVHQTQTREPGSDSKMSKEWAHPSKGVGGLETGLARSLAAGLFRARKGEEE